MNIQDECIKIHSQYGMSEMANYKIQLLFDSEIEKVKKEYEEKLRWIPVEEKLPELREKQYQVESMSVAGTRSQWTIESDHDIESLKGQRIAWRYFL